MKTSDPAEKEMARERKEDRKENAELSKQEASGGGTGYTPGAYNRSGGDARGGGGFGADEFNRGHTTTNTTTGTGTGFNDAGDTAGAGNQDFRSMNWEEPNNAAAGAGTRRNTRVNEDDPYYRSY